MLEPPDKPQLQDLLQRAALGDQEAWRLIVEVYSPRVFALIRASSGNVDLAEEITQSTFVTIVTKIESYTEVGKFEAWLFKIAMNRFRDEMRRRGRQARPVEDEALQGLAGADPDAVDPGRSSGGEVRTRSLERALARLSDADQRIVHLRYYTGLSFKQIADVLDQPLGTVLARQHRALKKLRDLMGGPPPAGEEP